MDSTERISRLLEDLEGGRSEAFDELFSVVYHEMRSLAHRQRRRIPDHGTLNTTALVHEVYLKLGSRTEASWRSKAHFLAVAAKAARQILLNYARDRAALKRGGKWRRTTLDGSAIGVPYAPASGQAELLIDLDQALDRLSASSERLSRIVECRFFGDMSIEQTAAASDVSTATVTRGWATAQAWLHRELERESETGPG